MLPGRRDGPHSGEVGRVCPIAPFQTRGPFLPNDATSIHNQRLVTPARHMHRSKLRVTPFLSRVDPFRNDSRSVCHWKMPRKRAAAARSEWAPSSSVSPVGGRGTTSAPGRVSAPVPGPQADAGRRLSRKRRRC